MLKFITSIVLLFIFIFSTPLSAQVLNVEKIRADADTTGWTGELAFDASLNKFNDRVIKLGGEANASFFSSRHVYLLLSNLDLVNVDGASLVSNGYIHSRATFLRKEKLSPELFVQYQYNENLGLKNRGLAGGGIRFTLLSRPGLRGHFSTGLMSEYEEWGLSDNQSAENTFLKSTNNLVIRGRLSPQASLSLIGYYQARPGHFFKPRVTSENRLNIRISEQLSFQLSFALTYDFEPVIDIPNLTYELQNGLVYSF